ncbi:MAG: metal-dependent hydrolase [Clostridium sp.]|nr:metal-dependent hydrolase [Clostridium sp.]
MMVGIAATLAVTKPDSISEMILAVGCGAVGALISDIDVGTSKSHRDADKVIVLAAFVVLGIIAADYFLDEGIVSRIIVGSGYVRVLAGVFLFIGICAFGKEQPHRSFMHSFLALLLLCMAIGLVWEKAVPYFAVGFLSHLATDIFNRRKVRLLYPMEGGMALNLFHAHGLANTVLFYLGSIATVAEIAVLSIGILR